MQILTFSKDINNFLLKLYGYSAKLYSSNDELTFHLIIGSYWIARFYKFEVEG